MISRFIDSSTGVSTPERLIVIVILLPGVPRILSTASLSDRPCTVLPSSATIRSPAFTPARIAGVSSIGETTRM